jgi:glycosyltransferase involved in cell wall biosynthesis
MTPAAFAIPGDITLPTGGYTYDRRVLALLPACGVVASHIPLPASFPQPSVADLARSEALLSAVAPACVLLIDGLAFGAMPAALLAKLSAPIVALIHHPLCLEAGLSSAKAAQLFALERTALTHAKRVITTSRTTARTLMADFAVAEGLLAVAEPGTDAASRATGTGQPLQLLAVGAVVVRKAYDILIRALKPFESFDWQLTIVGPIDRSAQALAALKTALQETGLGERVVLLGAVGEEHLARLYAAADVFLMPSLYEGYGMVLAEALARGLPIVCTTGGAAAATAPDAAAIKIPPGDAAALGWAIGQMLADPDRRRRMSDAAWLAGQRLPRWEATARIIAGVLKELAP